MIQFENIAFPNLANGQTSISWGQSGYYELIGSLPVDFKKNPFAFSAEIIEEAELVWANDEDGNPYVLECVKIGKIKIINTANVF